MHRCPHPKVLLWGGGSQARIVVEMLRETGSGEAALIFDPALRALSFPCAVPLATGVRDLKARIPGLSHFIVCIGAEHGFARVRTAQYLARLGLSPLSVVHPRSFVDATAEVGAGSVVMPGAVVHKFTRIGAQAVVNTCAAIDHECVVGQGVHVMGSAAVAGRVQIGDFATIGTNATVLPDLHIGDRAFVGAGAVVTRDVPDNAVVAGVPARYVRDQQSQFFEEALQELLG
jgi:sugar O-acyltransferase (sialic acid O-acetyltransferase NeuD family)